MIDTKPIGVVNIKKLGSIQAIRGLAALFVALGHLYYAFFSPPDMALAIGPEAAKELLVVENNMPKFWAIVPGSAIWVDVFFLISGFVIEITVSKIGPIGFLVQRAFRIYSVFWIACICHLFAIIFVFGYQPPEGWLNNFFLMSNYSLSPVSWTLIVEVHFYILIAILAALKLSSISRICAINVLFFCYYAGLLLNFIPNHLASWIGEVFYFSWMSLGAVLFLLFSTPRDDAKYKTFSKLFVFVVLSVYFQYQMVFDNRFGVQVFRVHDTIALVSAFAIFSSAIFIKPGYYDRISNFLGDISYPLYCLHFPVGWVGHYIFVAKLNLSPLGSLVLVFPLVIFVSYLAHRLVEDPFNRLGKRISVRFCRKS